MTLSSNDKALELNQVRIWAQKVYSIFFRAHLCINTVELLLIQIGQILIDILVTWDGRNGYNSVLGTIFIILLEELDLPEGLIVADDWLPSVNVRCDLNYRDHII